MTPPVAPRPAKRSKSKSAKVRVSVNPPGIDYHAHPEKYRIGVGEQGVLTVEPYKSQMLPHWRFRTPALAEASASALMQYFVTYKEQGDFVGMDMARKFLQMGITRSRRYANHANGRKYASDGTLRPREENPEKARCAEIFGAVYRAVRDDPEYQARRAAHKAAYP
jgi:hypothetical protein